MLNNLASDPAYTEVITQMRQRLHDWMVETRDLGLIEERELHQRAQGRSLWAVGQELDNYERILDTANLQLQGANALPELKIRSNDTDPLIRYWAILGLATVTQTAKETVVEGILPNLREALLDSSIDVRLTAADALCNLGYYGDTVEVLCQALSSSEVSVQIRAACILDSQPPEANDALSPTIDYLEKAAALTNVRKIAGIPYGLNNPLKRALQVVSRKAHYYRWGMGASGSPKSSLMKVQETPYTR